MDYIYMQKLKNWDESKSWNSTSEQEQDIISLQSEYNILFPQSFKEYLLISGEECPAIVQGHGFKYLSKQQQAQYLLKDYNLEHLITKPFWVIATHEDAFWYFHLDEGDNPSIYRLDCGYYGDSPEEYTFGKVADSFQEWIEKAIAFYEEDPENK